MTALRMRSNSADCGNPPMNRIVGKSREDARVTDRPGKLLDVAVDLARAAGRLLRDRPADLHAATKSSPTDAVTVMDRAAERLIIEQLSVRRPGDRVLAEESGRHGGAA